MTTLIFVDKPAVARIVLNHLPADIDKYIRTVFGKQLRFSARAQSVSQ